MKKNVKSCVEIFSAGDSRCLLDMNHYQRLEKTGLLPDLRHNRSSHMTAAWHFETHQRISIPMGGADLSPYRFLTFSVFAKEGKGGTFSLMFDSSSAGEGTTGYEETFEILHNGWNDYRVELPMMRAIGKPAGWQKIGSLCLDCLFGGQANRTETVLYLDNLYVWEGMAPPLYCKMPELKGAAVFSKSGRYAIVDRKRVSNALDAIDATPFEEKGSLLLPMAPVCAVLAHAAVADNLANTLSFTYRRKKFFFEANKKFVLVNGEKESLDFAPVAKDGVLFFPADYVKDFFRWRQLFADPTGLVILSNRKHILDSVEDASVIRQLLSDTTFVRPTAEKLLADLHRRFPNPLRGRLLASFDDLMQLRKTAKSEEQLKSLTELVKTAYGKGSAAFLQAPSLEDFSAACDRLWNFSLLYRMTGDKKYCERAYAEALALTELEEWESRGLPMLGELSLAISVCYDWCHHVWTEGQKAALERGMLRKGMRVGLDFYNGKRSMWRQGGVSAAKMGAGMLAMAITLADVYPETALRLIDRVMGGLEACFAAFSPDGGSAESVLAWEQAAKALALAVAMLQKACGSDYGFSSFPGWRATAYFPIYTETANGIWNYHACKNTSVDTSVLSFFASLNSDHDLAWLRYTQIQSGAKSVDPLDILFYQPVNISKTPHLALDCVYRRAGLAVMRSDWTSGANVLGLHGGCNRVSGGDLDAGNLLLELGGERFFCETGGEETLPTMLRRRAVGQNTLVVAPTKEPLPDQNPAASAPLLEMRSDAERAYAVVDLSDTNELLLRAKRGVLLTEKRSCAVIQDELTVAQPTEVVWSAWTKAEVVLNRSGRTAKLTQNGKTMLCRLGGVGHPARFALEHFQESGLTRIFVTVAVREKLRMCVVCRLLEEGTPASQKIYDLIPISQWAR